MPSPNELDPNESFAILFGNEVRELRTRAKMSQERLGDLLGYTGSLVGQVENGRRKPQSDFVQKADEVLEAGGLLLRLWPYLGRTPYPEYFKSYAELEPMASRIQDYGGPFIPGLGQTERYARHLTLSGHQLDTDEEIEDLVSGRMSRQSLLRGPDRPQLWWLLDEVALRRPVGGHGVMAEQLRHLASLIRSRTAIVQVIETREGSHALLGGVTTILSFRDGSPDVVYMEGPSAGVMHEGPEIVRKHQTAYDQARARALGSEASLALIDRIAEEHERHDRPE
ncbi:helix-turn-helix domain-containing protein [Kitasatospora sp. NPDC004289]